MQSWAYNADALECLKLEILVNKLFTEAALLHPAELKNLHHLWAQCLLPEADLPWWGRGQCWGAFGSLCWNLHNQVSDLSQNSDLLCLHWDLLTVLSHRCIMLHLKELWNELLSLQDTSAPRDHNWRWSFLKTVIKQFDIVSCMQVTLWAPGKQQLLALKLSKDLQN